MQNTLQIHTKTPKNWDLPHKITQFKHFSSRIHQKIGTFVVIFLKNWEIHTTCYTANLKSNNLWWRNSEKLEIFRKTVKRIFNNIYLQIICGSTRV